MDEDEVVDETSTSITVGSGESKGKDVSIDTGAITEDNILVQKDYQGNPIKMFVKDASGKIVAELKPMSADKATPPTPSTSSTKTPVTPKLTSKPSSAEVDKQLENVRLTTKLTVAGIHLPSNATKEEITAALNKDATKKRKLNTLTKAKMSNRPSDLLQADYTAERYVALCDVPNCKSQNYDRALKYFRVPSTLSGLRRAKWMHAVGKPSIQATFADALRNVHVCELHFEQDCFENPKERDRLKPDSVPTVAVARVTSVVTAADKVQEILVPPARLGPDTSVNAPLSAMLMGLEGKAGGGGSAASYEIPLIEQQVRTHRFALEKLEKAASVPVGVNAEIVIDRGAPAKEIKLKAEILSRRRRIQELQRDLSAKTKQLREESKAKEAAALVSADGDSAAAAASELMNAVRAPSIWGRRPHTTIDFKKLVEKRASAAERSRDFYVAKTMAALKGQDLDPEELETEGQVGAEGAKGVKEFKEKESKSPGCIYLQPADTKSALPPLVLSGNPLASMKFLADEKLKYFLRKQAKKYTEKMEVDGWGPGKPRVGFMLTTIDDPEALMDLKEVVEVAKPVSASKDTLADAVEESGIPEAPPTVVHATHMNVTQPQTSGNAKLVKEVDALNKAMAEMKAQNDQLTAQLQTSRYEVEFMTSKLKNLPKSQGGLSETGWGKDSQIAKLKDELAEIRKWKTKFLKKERARLQKTRKIIEKRKLRRDWIMKEIAAGRKTQKDMYLIYSKSKLPIDQQDDDAGGGMENSFDDSVMTAQGGFVDETEAAVAGISGGVAAAPARRYVPAAHTARASPVKGPGRPPSKPKYASPPSNPTQVFTYKLKPTQKVHLPADHPQTPTIRNKERVEVVFNDQQEVPQLQGGSPYTVVHGTVRGAGAKRAAAMREGGQPAAKRQARAPAVKIKGKARKGGGKWMAETNETDTSDDYHSESETEAAAAVVETYKQEVIQQHEVVQQVQIQGQPVQEVQVQYQQLPTAAGTVTLKYDNVQYANPEFIQMPVATTTPAVGSAGGATVAYGQEQMDFIVRTVDDLEQLKYGAGTSAPTYYIQPAPTAANVAQLAPQQVVVTQSGQQIQIQPQHHVVQQRTSPRKQVRYSKYGNAYQQ